MAGTVTTSETRHTSVKKIKFEWVSSAGGAADATSTYFYDGLIERIVQIPDSGGTIPTDLYDVVVNDADGTDILHGLGANLTNAAVTLKSSADGLGAVVESQLTIAVTNAGDSKGGKTIIYLR